MTTDAPSAAIAVAMAFPIPVAAPVTIATLFWSFIVSSQHFLISGRIYLLVIRPIRTQRKGNNVEGKSLPRGNGKTQALGVPAQGQAPEYPPVKKPI